MAIGTYGTVRPALVDPNDIEIFYTFAPNRQTKPSAVMTLNPLQVIEAIKSTDNNDKTYAIGGLFQLTLPANVFDKKGIYTIAIRPKRIFGKILDCGVLSALPDVKGIVIKTDDFKEAGNNAPISTDTKKTKNGGLVGYRVEYFDTVGGVKTLRNDNFTVVTWSNKCEAVSNNIGNVTQKSVAYRFTDTNTGILFLTVTPSTGSSVRPNQRPDIGVAEQEILLTNPYFDPYYLEVELTDYDMESLAIGLYGEQTRSIEDGIITWYRNVTDKNGATTKEIYKQSVLKEVLDDYNETLFEVKENLPNIDDSKEWKTIMDD
jgi:hypothetical protein